MTPTVTIITPTTHERKAFNDRISDIANTQDYPNIIEHLFSYDNFKIGAKRNHLAQAAKGKIIVHMDSDDWYSPQWVSKCVSLLLRTNCDIVGVRAAYFYNEYIPKAWEWIYDKKNSGAAKYVCEASMVYRKSLWMKSKFPDKQIAEGKSFLHGRNIEYLDGMSDFIGCLHGQNTSSQTVTSKYPDISSEIPKNIINLWYK